MASIVAFCGKPNVGKSALINALAGSRLRVGNWSGVTVEKYEAYTEWEGEQFHLVDLPGIRDLSYTTHDQRIATNFLFDPSVSICVNVLESTNLQDNLSVSIQLKEICEPLGISLIFALNFADEFKQIGWELDAGALEKELGHPVLLVSARHKTGIEELKALIVEQSLKLQVVRELGQSARDTPDTKGVAHKASLRRLVETALNDGVWRPLLLANLELLCLENLSDLEMEFAPQLIEQGARFESQNGQSYFESRFAQLHERTKEITQRCLKRSRETRNERTQRADRILLHQIAGPILSLFVMLVVFSATFSFADPLINFVDQFFSYFLYTQVGILTAGAPPWIDSLIRDGLLTGLGLVLSFTPLMFILYVMIGLVEESGYMVRIAFMADRIMMHMGVSGRSLLPLFMGFGCNVPTIYATRTLESEGEKRITGFLAGFMSCGARMPVLGLFTAVFLGPWAGFAVVGLYILGILIAALVSLVLKHLNFFRSDGTQFVMDVPPYRWPLASTLLKTAGFRTSSYVKRASTRILALLGVLWFFTYFPSQGDIEQSYAGHFARWIQPIFRPLGFGDHWQLIGALPTAIVAKEGALAALGQFLGSTEDEEAALPLLLGEALQEQGTLLLESLRDAFSFDIVGILSAVTLDAISEDFGRGIIGAVRQMWANDPLGWAKALSFAIFILLVVPCIVALGAMRQEFGRKFMGSVVLVYLAIPYIGSLIFFQLARLVG